VGVPSVDEKYPYVHFSWMKHKADYSLLWSSLHGLEERILMVHIDETYNKL
jgi:hypothetical protein